MSFAFFIYEEIIADIKNINSEQWESRFDAGDSFHDVLRISSFPESEKIFRIDGIVTVFWLELLTIIFLFY